MTHANVKKATHTLATKKLLALLLAFISLFATLSASQIDAQAAEWRTGRFDSGYTAKGYTTVYLTKKNGKLQNGKIKVFTYDMMGWKSKAKLHIVLRTTGGRWICEFDTTSGSTLKLGNDHAAYRVYIAPKKLKNSGDDFVNLGKCCYWAIHCTSNTYV